MLENLNFSFSHKEKLLIAFLLKESQSGKMDKKEIKKYKKLLPSLDDLYWLHHILDLSICINENRNIQNIDFKLQDNVLYIESISSMFLCKECVKKLKNRVSLQVMFS
jgi:exopolyphosphatase/guanosine-5'-triphosphate,3'-diphosphate pyrophosphatase